MEGGRLREGHLYHQVLPSEAVTQSNYTSRVGTTVLVDEIRFRESSLRSTSVHHASAVRSTCTL